MFRKSLKFALFFLFMCLRYGPIYLPDIYQFFWPDLSKAGMICFTILQCVMIFYAVCFAWFVIILLPSFWRMAT